MGVGNGDAERPKCCLQLAVINTHKYEGATFLLNERYNLRVIVSFVFTPEDKYYWRFHTFEGTVASIHVGSFRVVDKVNAIYAPCLFQPVFYPREVAQTLADNVF